MEKVLYVGVGGAGCNMTNRLVRNDLRGEFVAVNSDAQHLSFVHKKIRKIVIGRKLLHSTGCAGDVELAERVRNRRSKLLSDLYQLRERQCGKGKTEKNA